VEEKITQSYGIRIVVEELLKAKRSGPTKSESPLGSLKDKSKASNSSQSRKPKSQNNPRESAAPNVNTPCKRCSQ
jgi:hypothetical protein